MKKISWLFCAALAALSLASCMKESYNHQVALVGPGFSGNHYPLIYADQTVDTLRFMTYDSYDISKEPGSYDDFVTFDESLKHKTIKNSYLNYYLFRIPVYFTANTGDKCRYDALRVVSKSEIDDWMATVTANYYQVNVHHFGYPAVDYVSLVDKKPYDIVMKDSAAQVSDTILFKAYDDWSITSDNEAVVKPVNTTGTTGIQKIALEVAQVNETPDTLRAKLTLLSRNGAKSVIQFRQAPKKKK